MNSETGYEANQDPDRLEREIDEQRREINETLRALEAKFTKEEIAGQLVNYFGGAGKEWLGTLGSSMKHNPVPTLLTGVGIAWLMMSERNGSRPQYYDDERYARSYGGAYGSSYEGEYGPGYESESEQGGVFAGAADAAHGAAQGIKEKAGAVGEKAAHAREALGERASHARERASHARERMGERAMHAREAVRERAANARYGMRHSAESVRTNFSHLAHEQPLALGAIGIALGALLGVALPRTERETRVLGRASERVRERGMEMAREGYEKASHKASEVADKAKDVLHRTMEEKHRQMMNSGKDGEGDGNTGYSATTNTLYSTSGAQAASSDANQGDNAAGTLSAQQQASRAGTAPGA